MAERRSCSNWKAHASGWFWWAWFRAPRCSDRWAEASSCGEPRRSRAWGRGRSTSRGDLPRWKPPFEETLFWNSSLWRKSGDQLAGGSRRATRSSPTWNSCWTWRAGSATSTRVPWDLETPASGASWWRDGVSPGMRKWRKSSEGFGRGPSVVRLLCSKFLCSPWSLSRDDA